MDRSTNSSTERHVVLLLLQGVVTEVGMLCQRITNGVARRVRSFCGWFEGFYLIHPRLLAFQCNVAYLASFFCLWQSKMYRDHFHERAKSVACMAYLIYYGFHFMWLLSPRPRPRPLGLVMTPAMRAGVHWLIQAVVNFISGSIQEQAAWADWYATCTFLLLYVHLISFMKMRGHVSDFGAIDSILAIGVSSISHLLGGIFTKLVIPLLSALVLLITECMKLSTNVVPTEGDIESGLTTSHLTITES